MKKIRALLLFFITIMSYTSQAQEYKKHKIFFKELESGNFQCSYPLTEGGVCGKIYPQ